MRNDILVNMIYLVRVLYIASQVGIFFLMESEKKCNSQAHAGNASKESFSSLDERKKEQVLRCSPLLKLHV